MASLVQTGVPQSKEGISTSSQLAVDMNDLAQAGETLRHNLGFAGHVLQETCHAVQNCKSDNIRPDAPVRASLYQIGVELERLALSGNQFFASIMDLHRASLSPPVAIALVIEALALIDASVTVIQNSAQTVQSLCRGNVLPWALFSPYNPIPTLYQYLPKDMVPPTVALWQKLACFTDVCVALDGVLHAIHTFRCFVQQAVDEQATRFQNREMMKNYREALGKIKLECIGLKVDVRHLLFHCQSPGRGESLYSKIYPHRLHPSDYASGPRLLVAMGSFIIYTSSCDTMPR
ncbi:hypothetical protein FB45DRAFT_115326 [Roridomyces roridus]|uniref:Uncharacterized protein n=1 Tax=Roridomyces roridus TaxID=1738132 RepID=A0AAD7FH28_9AGAR|nr:hypothetical protein FB45DRAFT_115326 [Roridomyces roridus]